jgi:integrase
MRGSIRQRSKGSWSIQVSGGFDPLTGKRVRKTSTVRGNRAAAERELTRLQREVDQGESADPGRASLAHYLEARWLPHSATRVRPRTHERYQSLVRVHIAPKVGRIPMAKLRPAHVQSVLDGMLAGGSKPRSVVQAYRVLSQALAQAVRWQLLSHNPAAAIKPPRPERPQLHVPDAETVRELLRAAEGTPAYVPLLLCAAGGLRRGEALGLRWRDVDGATVRVVGTLQRVRRTGGYRLETREPKTDRARRNITLPAFAADALRSWRKEQAERQLLLGPAWKDNGLVCDRGDGSPWDPSTFSHHIEDLGRRAGLPRFRLHDLRHAVATRLLEAGVHPKVVSEALGHSSVSFTLDVYSHVIPSMGEQVGVAMEAAIGPGGSKTGIKPGQ